MSIESSNQTSQTDWKRLRALKDDEICLSAEHPEADPAHIVRGIIRYSNVCRRTVECQPKPTQQTGGNE